MYILDANIVKQQLDMPTAIDAIERLLKVEATHPSWVKTPERLVIPTFKESDSNSTGSHLSMPSVVYDGEKEYTVVKLVTICPDNPKRGKPTTIATITVSDNATGETLVFMDGVYVTQVRTAALSGIATKYLANPDSHTVAVIGTGGMAYEQLNAVLTVRPNIKTVQLWNRTRDTAEDFKDNFQQDYSQWDVDIQVFDDMQDALKNADIINLATRATEGLFEVSDISDNAHINAVGAYQPAMKEVSNSVIEASEHIFIDDMAGGKHEAGDLIQADAATDCEWTWTDISGSLADLVSGKKTVNNEPDNKGITVFKSVGAASFDAAVALEVAKLAQDKALGKKVEI